MQSIEIKAYRIIRGSIGFERRTDLTGDKTKRLHKKDDEYRGKRQADAGEINVVLIFFYGGKQFFHSI